jgi:hypothetical protein
MGQSLKTAIRETKEWMQINGSPDADDDDACDHLMEDCGKDASGRCSLAGTEYCDWECPFS